MVKVRTTIVTNFEMSMLHDDSCPVSNVHVWFGSGTIGPNATEYAIVDSSEALSRETTIQWQRCPVVTLAQRKETRAMFRKMQKQEKRQGYGSATATVMGLFQYIPADKIMALKGADGKIWKTSGFGHQLCCNARVLPGEIQDVTLTPKSNR